MDITKIQTLIAQGKIVNAGDIDPDTSYLQVGVWQEGTRQKGAAGEAYPSYAIALTDLVNVPVPPPTLQQVVNQGNGLSNFGGTGTAWVQSTNFVNNRSLYLNKDNYPAIRIVNNLNASNYIQIDINTLTLNGVGYSWSSIVATPTLQQILNFNHDLVNGNNFQGTDAGSSNTGDYVNAFGVSAADSNTGSDINAFGRGAARNNTALNLNAMGKSAGYSNSGSDVNAFGENAAASNSGNFVNALGNQAAQNNTGVSVNAIGLQAAKNNTNYGVNAFGNSAASFNSGTQVNAIGERAASQNGGSDVNAIGYQAAYQNTGNNIVAIGSNSGTANTLSGQVIINNSYIPAYPNAAAAAVGLAGGVAGNSYLYWDSGLNVLNAVRL